MKKHESIGGNILTAILLFGTAAFAAGPGAGIKIVFFPGGSEGGPFASIVYNGAKAAQDVLGCDVEYIWSGLEQREDDRSVQGSHRPKARRHLPSWVTRG
jgi:basic membrane lipoprotein Med (substrate-binding protein (PBP1-ABC) superfamily)